jgi:hypothetical protein
MTARQQRVKTFLDNAFLTKVDLADLGADLGESFDREVDLVVYRCILRFRHNRLLHLDGWSSGILCQVKWPDSQRQSSG